MNILLTVSSTPYTVLSVKSFGAKGDGKTDDTAAINRAATAAQAAHQTLWFPAGTYLTDTITWPFTPGSTVNDCSIIGDGIQSTRITSLKGNDILVIGRNSPATAPGTVPATWPVNISGLSLFGIGPAGNTGRGLVLQNLYAGNIRDLWIVNCGGDAVYADGQTYSTSFTNVLAGWSGGYAFNLWCGPAVLLVNCYALTCPAGKSTYWLAAGQFSLIGCNCIMQNGETALRVGASPLDGITYQTSANVSLVGCNLESWTMNGIQVRAGASTRLHVGGSTIIMGAGNGTTGITFENAQAAANTHVDETVQFVNCVNQYSGGTPGN